MEKELDDLEGKYTYYLDKKWYRIFDANGHRFIRDEDGLHIALDKERENMESRMAHMRSQLTLAVMDLWKRCSVAELAADPEWEEKAEAGPMFAAQR